MVILYIGNFLNKFRSNYDGPNEQLVTFFKNQGHIVKKSGRQKNKFKRLLEQIKDLLISRFDKTDLVIIDVFSTKAFIFAFIGSTMSWIIRKKYLLILHGGDLPKRFRKNPILSKFILTRAYKIISPSKYLAEETDFFFGLSVVVIPNFIELNISLNATRKKNEIIWVRSFGDIYNPKMALKVIEYLKKNGCQKCHLTMVGPITDEQKKRIEKMIKSMSLDGSVHITGKLGRNEWHDLGKHKTYFINTTNVDNTPSSVIEALGLGLVVLSTNVGGIPYIIENLKNGVLVNKGDYKEMAKAILQMEKDEEKKKRITNNSISYFNNTYSYNKIAEQWIKLLKNEFYLQ